MEVPEDYPVRDTIYVSVCVGTTCRPRLPVRHGKTSTPLTPSLFDSLDESQNVDHSPSPTRHPHFVVKRVKVTDVPGERVSDSAVDPLPYAGLSTREVVQFVVWTLKRENESWLGKKRGI